MSRRRREKDVCIGIFFCLIVFVIAIFSIRYAFFSKQDHVHAPESTEPLAKGLGNNKKLEDIIFGDENVDVNRNMRHGLHLIQILGYLIVYLFKLLLRVIGIMIMTFSFAFLAALKLGIVDTPVNITVSGLAAIVVFYSIGWTAVFLSGGAVVLCIAIGIHQFLNSICGAFDAWVSRMTGSNQRHTPQRISQGRTGGTGISSVLQFLNNIFQGFSSSRGQHSEGLFSRFSDLWESKLGEIKWGFKNSIEVGVPASFIIKLSKPNKNAQPQHKISTLQVQIVLDNNPIEHVIETTGMEENQAKVQFTVFKAGTYEITVKSHGKHVADSPYFKKFIAGPVDPDKCELFISYPLITTTLGSSLSLKLKAKDKYDNPCKPSSHSELLKEKNYTFLRKKIADTEFEPIGLVPQNGINHVSLITHVSEEGCYDMVLDYKSTRVKNGEVTLIALNDESQKVVNKAVRKKGHKVYFEARLVDPNGYEERAKKVYCYIYPKQFTVWDYHLKIIPKRLYTFRVRPSTKISFHGSDNRYKHPMFTLEDGSQSPLQLAAKERNEIAAVFSSFLLRNIGGSVTFEQKQEFFHSEVLKEKPEKTGSVDIKVHRQDLLTQSHQILKNLSSTDWQKSFRVKFRTEEGLDWGGLKREWFQLMFEEIFDPEKSGLFVKCSSGSQAAVYPNADIPQYFKLRHYEVAGKLVGKCLYDSARGRSYALQVKAKFTRSFLAQLLGYSINHWYLEQDDPELYNTKVKYIKENDVDDMDLTFSEDIYVNGFLERVEELTSGGKDVPVTNSNKMQYLDALAQYKLVNKVKPQIEAFLKGLTAVIPQNLLNIFDEDELELLMCGITDYNVEDLKSHCAIPHSFAGSKVIRWFWTTISGFTTEQMARLLQFTTGSSQLPPGGFAELAPNFQIDIISRKNCLPIAHTCFNQICLPDYDSLEQFQHFLLMAIHEGNQGFGFI